MKQITRMKSLFYVLQNIILMNKIFQDWNLVEISIYSHKKSQDLLTAIYKWTLLLIMQGCY